MGPALKTAQNPHLRSKYADLGSVMDACFAALHANGFAVLQPGGADEHGPFVDTVFVHETGHEFRSRCYLVIGKQDMQGVGSAWTYARRYGLMALAGIAPEDDDGEGTKKPKSEHRREHEAKSQDVAPDVIRDRIKASIAKAADPDKLKALWEHPATVKAFLSMPPDMQADLVRAHADKDAFFEGHGPEDYLRAG